MKALLTQIASLEKQRKQKLKLGEQQYGKSENELFPKDSVPGLNTKKLGNSPRFLTNTHMTLSTKRSRSYGILRINIAAEFCFWTEQRPNGA
jgi:hypothetical protein